jgi:hypothetical protein
MFWGEFNLHALVDVLSSHSKHNNNSIFIIAFCFHRSHATLVTENIAVQVNKDQKSTFRKKLTFDEGVPRVITLLSTE